MSYEEFIAGYKAHHHGSKLGMLLVFVASDLLTILLSFGSGFFIVNMWNMDAINFKSFVTYWPYLPAFLIVFSIVRLYPGLSLAHAEELRRFSIASFLGHAGIILSLFIVERRLDAYSVAFALSWIASVPLFASARGLARRIFVTWPFWGQPVIIFGAGKTGRLVVDRLLRRPWIGFKPALFLDDDPKLAGEYRGIPILTGTALGPRVATDIGWDTAIVAMPGVERGRLANIVTDYVRSFRHYTLIPDFFGLTSIWMSIRDFDGIMGLYTDQRLLMPWNVTIKRCLDVIICLLGGLLITPIFLLFTILVLVDSPGPAFYGHVRLGKDGKPFKAWKFRSMYRNSKDMLEELLERDPVAKAEWNANFKLKDDPRVTAIGRFLRRTSLDELPQLWNVLRGDMSLIGPRPIVTDEIEKYGHHYKLFSSVKPGMSGLWQVSGRSETDYEERVALDIYYIQSWSLWLDLYVFFKTVVVVFGGKGAY